MNELEEKLLEELNPLIQEFLLREESKTEELNAWLDKRIPNVVEKEKYHDQEENELLQKLQEEKGYQERKKIIAELQELRDNKKELIKEQVINKVQGFLEEQREKVAQELEEKSKQLIELEGKGKILLAKRTKVYRIKNAVSVSENPKIYTATKEEEKDIMNEMHKLSKQHHVIQNEKRTIETYLKQIEEKYSQIDFSNIENIRALLKEPSKKEEEKVKQESQTPGMKKNTQPQKELKLINITKRNQTKKDNLAKVEEPVIVQKMKNKQSIKTNQQEKQLNNEAVRILYSARNDKYLVINQNKKKEEIVGRTELRKISKKRLAEKNGRTVEDLKNIDMNILQLLIAYDKQNKTEKAKEYYTMMTQIGKSKKDRQQEMKEHQIDIEYNLNGLYDKNSKIIDKDARKLLRIANNAKQKGIATVKKGMKVTVAEWLDKMFSKIHSYHLPEGKKILTLPESKKTKERNAQKERDYAQLVNGEYMKTLDSDFEKEVRKTQKEKFKEGIKQKILPKQKQEEFSEVFARMDQAAKQKIQGQGREEK